MDNTASCMIEVCDLHKHYKDVHVLRGISTTVAKGEVCAVIGPSGSGKSTFLRCLNRLEEASSGEIFINAQEITDPPPEPSTRCARTSAWCSGVQSLFHT